MSSFLCVLFLSRQFTIVSKSVSEVRKFFQNWHPVLNVLHCNKTIQKGNADIEFYQSEDGGDQDFGSGGIALLDPTVFQGTGVSRLGVTVGKNGKIYILDVNNMGQYPSKPVLQSWDPKNDGACCSWGLDASTPRRAVS